MRSVRYVPVVMMALFVVSTYSPVAFAANEADLSVTIATPVASILQGGVVYNYVTVKNNGPTAAASFTLTDVVPTGFTFDQAGSTASCTLVGSSVTCPSTKINAGSSRRFTLKFTTSTAACGLAVMNVASISSATDSNSANNTSNTVSTTVGCPDFSVSIAPPVANILQGQVLQYRIAVTNNGTAAAPFTLIDAVPVGLTFISGSSTCVLNGANIECPSSKLLPGAVRNFNLYFSTTSAACLSVINNTAGVSAQNDSNALNNTSNTVSTTVTCETTDLSVTKTATSSVLQGNEISYIITIKNQGLVISPNTVGTDVLPAGMTVVSALGCKITGATVACNAGTLAPGKSRSFTIKARTSGVACNTSVSNTVTVAGKILDSNSTNNSSTASTQVMCPVASENELTIIQKQTASADTAVANQKNINLLRFEARAENEGILFTDIAFTASGLLANGQNYSVHVDADDNGVVDTVLQSGVNVVGDQVIFHELVGGGYSVPAFQTVVFEVHADVIASPLFGVSQLKFATLVPGYIGAEKLVNGSNLVGIKTNAVCATTCEITVVTAAATVWNFRSQGDLFITKSVIPVRTRQLLGGTLSDEVLRVQLRAQYEDIDVTNFVFSAIGANSSSVASNVDRLELYKVGSVTPFAAATVGGCGTDIVPANSMCAQMQGQQLVIPKGNDVSFLVRPRMRSDLDGAVSHQNVQFTIDAVLGAKALGYVSSNKLAQNNSDAVSQGELFIGVQSPSSSVTITGQNHVVVLSKIVSITNADPNANGTAIPTGAGRQIGQFKFSAAAANNLKNGNNKFVLSDIIFNVNTTNVATDSGSYKLYNKADPSTKAPCFVTIQTSSSLLATCAGLTLGSVNTEIDQGSDTTFVLEATITNPKISNSSTSTLQVSLQNFDSITNVTFGPAVSHLRWLDKDNGASTSFLWIEYPETSIIGTSYNG